jgi:dihydroflavonol-4-reductase
MRVAVTGATGHVGANLVRTLLSQGHDVRALVHIDNKGIAGLGVKVFGGSLMDEAALDRAFSGAELVFHAAARISIAPGDEREVYETNVLGTRNVLRACERAGVGRLLHFSSIHAQSAEPLDEVIDEERGLASGDGLLVYDRSKADAERQVRAAVKRGLDVVVAIPTAVLGPHDYRPSPMGRVLLDLYQQDLLALVDGGFDWVDVRDVVDGAMQAAERGRSGERFLLSGHHRTLAQVAETMEQVSGRSAPAAVAPMWLARFAAPFSTAYAQLLGRAPRLTGASLHALCHHQKVSHARASEVLGYRSRPFETTVADTLGWFRAAGVVP